MARDCYEPGGASRHGPAVLTGVHDLEKVCEKSEMRVRIARRHDALIASNADPTALFIKKPPAKSPRRRLRCLVYL